MNAMTLVKTLFIKAPPAHVWRFLVEKDRLGTWFHAGEKDVSKENGYSVVTNSPGKDGERLCWGAVLEFDPPRKLKHIFTHDHLKGVETVCTWTLEARDGGTVLTLVHEGFEKVAKGAFSMAADHDKGWDEHFVRLRRVAQ